ncbi:MAG: hypothetical protein NC408_04490 [Candidatus Gastranaerophilales bacterium]|nr:hypothetical protein [Candidatus Gastranaerophilales bacterium]MCM1072270.1 hypothetical protein [Bacteroides sp.]
MFNYNLYNYNNIFVDSIKEAEAAPIDFSGNPVFYLNKKENEVYLKQFNMQTGKTFFGKYVFAPIVPQEEPQKVDNEIMETLKRLEDKCNYLYERIEDKEVRTKKEKAVKDVE